MNGSIMRISNLTNNSPIVIHAGGGSIALSVNDVRRWLGAEDAPTHEIVRFLMMCRARSINPFLKEAHLFKVEGRSGTNWVTVVDISGWIEVAERHLQYDGHECGLVIQQVTPAKPARKTAHGVEPAEPEVRGEIRNIDETIRPDGWHAIGGWCRVYRKDRRIPTYRAVSMSEYNRDNRQWKALGLTMIVKVAVVQALAASGIVSRSGGYIPEELPGSGEEVGADAENDPGADKTDDRDIIDVETDETPAALPPKDDDGAGSDATYHLDTDIHVELVQAIESLGMTEYQVKSMLARRGVESIGDLSIGDARDIIAKLHLIYDQRHAGEILLPDKPDAGDKTAEATQGGDEASGEPTRTTTVTGELTVVDGDLVNADGEVVGTAEYVATKDGFRLTDNGHLLHTSKTHGCDPDRDPQNCPVCDYGLCVCTVCGAAEIELNNPCPGENRSPSDPPEAAAIQRVSEINTAFKSWQTANERGDFQVATGIIEDITAAYGPQAIADWGLAGSIDPPDPADSFEIPDSTRREERPAPPKRGRKKAGT